MSRDSKLQMRKSEERATLLTMELAKPRFLFSTTSCNSKNCTSAAGVAIGWRGSGVAGSGIASGVGWRGSGIASGVGWRSHGVAGSGVSWSSICGGCRGSHHRIRWDHCRAGGQWHERRHFQQRLCHWLNSRGHRSRHRRGLGLLLCRLLLAHGHVATTATTSTKADAAAAQQQNPGPDWHVEAG